jgi:hypothetical protein
VELDREVPAEAERLHAQGVTGQHRGPGRRQAPVMMELQPGPWRDQLGIRRIDRDPADLLVARWLHRAVERFGEHLRAEADSQHRHSGRVGPPQPGEILIDPGAGLAVVVHRTGRAEHDDVRQAGGVRERAILWEQVGAELRAASRERIPDEPRRIFFVVADDDDPHERPPIAGYLVWCQTTFHDGRRRPY